MSRNNLLSQMKIAVVDDHELIREGINAVLSHNGASHVDKFSTGQSLLESMCEDIPYDFYIIDLELPDMDGFDLIDTIRSRDPHAKIIVSTMHDEIWTLRKLLARNVDSILYKSGEGHELLIAIEEVMAGNTYYCEEVTNCLKAVEDSSMVPTTRELEVLYQIAQGKTSREIAANMFVTENTVEAHRKALFAKLGSVNVADLIMKSIKLGYLKKGW